MRVLLHCCTRVRSAVDHGLKIFNFQHPFVPPQCPTCPTCPIPRPDVPERYPKDVRNDPDLHRSMNGTQWKIDPGSQQASWDARH